MSTYPRRLLLLLLASLATQGLQPAQAADAMPAYASLAKMETLSEVMRNLYQWYLDEADFSNFGESSTIQFHVVPITPELDKDDKSLYAEIRIPLLQTTVLMKKTDYRIDELDLEIRAETFKIVNVSKGRTLPPKADQPGATITYPTKELLDYLFKTRNQHDYPSTELSGRLRNAISKKIDAYQAQAAGEQTIFISPLSPVGNDIWAYWVDVGLLLRWSSDIDLSNPAVWEHESLAIKVYDIEEQTVLAFQQAPGSNAYLTRDQVGRILYNCTVLGQMRRIQPQNQ
jgi:hypothetical protein